MVGLIRKREILRHPVLIIRGYGVVVFIRCLLAKSNTPFLTIVNFWS